MPAGWQLWIEDERPAWRVWVGTHKKTSWVLGILAGLFLLGGIGSAVGGPPPETNPAVGSGPAVTSVPAAPPALRDTNPQQQPAPKPETAQDEGAPAGVPAAAQKAVVRRIVDGDTLELAAVAAGSALPNTHQVDVRLLEIDAPETEHPNKSAQCYGTEATNHLAGMAPPGSTVWIQRDVELEDQYGRYMLYLWNAEGRFVNLAMVQDGYAKADLYMPNDRYWPQISGADNDVRTTDTGLWGACASFGEPEDSPEPQPAPEPQPEPELQPVPEPDPEPASSCAPGYSPCVPTYPPDVDCGDVGGPISVTGSDPHGLDGDGDGTACGGD